MYNHYSKISYPKISPTPLTNFDSNSKIPPLISEKRIIKQVITAQRKNLRGKSDKFIYLLRNKISNSYGN